MFNLDDLRNNPLNFAQTVDLALLEEAIEFLNKRYRDGKAIVSDDIYDLLVDILKKRDSNSVTLSKICDSVKLPGDKMVKLDYYMGSMNKIKPNSPTLHRFIKDNVDYVLSDKLDGISLLLVLRDRVYTCYTRGDGNNGQNITHLLSKDNLFIDGIVPDINIAVRGELVIHNKHIEKLGCNLRNIVAGYAGRKEADKSIQGYISFVTYEVLSKKMLPNVQFELLSKYFKASHSKACNNFDNSFLENYLHARKKYSDYSIDGIIITKNIDYNLISSGNPKHSVAFKMIMDEQIKETIIKDVIWNISKDGYIKPTVIFDRIVIGGCNYERANGVNADNIVKNDIGIGSKVEIIRSGDVIPNIFNVLTKGEVKMPSYKYKWIESGKDIIIDEKNEEQGIREIIYFFKILKIKGISEKIIRKMVSFEYDTLYKILTIRRNDLLRMDGIQNKMADNIIENISNAIDNSHISKIMTASNCFGRTIAEKKIVNVLVNIKDLFKVEYTDIELYKKVIVLNDFGELSANQFVKGFRLFKEFIKTHSFIKINIDNNKIVTGNIFDGCNICFTGVRDEEIELFIKKNNGIISTINKANILIYKTKDVGQKFKTAEEKEIHLVQIDDFKTKYCIQ